jgi:prevent-host-death family protein
MNSTQLGLSELRTNLSHSISRVREGKTFVVTDRGRPVARLVPIRDSHSIEGLITAGELIPAQGNVMDLFEQPIPEAGRVAPSEALKEMRDLEW